MTDARTEFNACGEGEVVEQCTVPHQSCGFEGPEKRLEIDFKKNPQCPEGLRLIGRDQWQEMLTEAKCTIISHMSNKYCDAFVLSESSLFVYPQKIMLKTCGTTTLLKCIPKLMEFANGLGLFVEFVMYSRKNFLFPTSQAFPHIDWDAEVDYLNGMFDGQAYVLGPLTQEHWHLYLADYSDYNYNRLNTAEKTLEIMMHNLDRASATQFYRNEGQGPDREKFPGMADLIPNSDTDEYNFAPCGYSMNGLSEEAYYTIHVTPEPHCSYSSFETNASLKCYKQLITKVLSIFRPGTFSVSFFYEKSPTDDDHHNFACDVAGYTLRHKTISEVEGGCEVVFCNYESNEHNARRRQTTAKVPPTAFRRN